MMKKNKYITDFNDIITNRSCKYTDWNEDYFSREDYFNNKITYIKKDRIEVIINFLDHLKLYGINIEKDCDPSDEAGHIIDVQTIDGRIKKDENESNKA